MQTNVTTLHIVHGKSLHEVVGGNASGKTAFLFGLAVLAASKKQRVLFISPEFPLEILPNVSFIHCSTIEQLESALAGGVSCDVIIVDDAHKYSWVNTELTFPELIESDIPEGQQRWYSRLRRTK